MWDHLCLPQRYSAQRDDLKSQVRDCSVGTVDAFQGREADVVIFSGVRAEPRAGLGFLKDCRRLNVLLTRARCGFIFVGSRGVFVEDPVWKRWFEFVDDHKCVTTETALLRS